MEESGWNVCADYNVGIQSACLAGEGSWDSIFTATFMNKQRQNEKFSWEKFSHAGNMQFPQFYATWGKGTDCKSEVKVRHTEFRFF